MTKTHTIEKFITLEKKVWNCLLIGDAKIDSQLLADDFLGVYTNGFSEKTHHVNALKNGPVISGYEISEARMKALSPDTILISYLANYKCSKSLTSRSVYITSIWQKQLSAWKNIFSQDTMANNNQISE